MVSKVLFLVLAGCAFVLAKPIDENTEVDQPHIEVHEVELTSEEAKEVFEKFEEEFDNIWGKITKPSSPGSFKDIFEEIKNVFDKIFNKHQPQEESVESEESPESEQVQSVESHEKEVSVESQESVEPQQPVEEPEETVEAEKVPETEE